MEIELPVVRAQMTDGTFIGTYRLRFSRSGPDLDSAEYKILVGHASILYDTKGDDVSPRNFVSYRLKSVR